ncbi:MAG: hypothetical protein NTZ68_04165 [Candidatus Dependentiae bacterium]|nr:hypothetical protein [Candidatus Dependentiae bacterium]
MFFMFFLASMLHGFVLGSEQSSKPKLPSYESLSGLSSSQRSCNDLPVKVVLAHGRYQWNPYAAPIRFITPINYGSPQELPATSTTPIDDESPKELPVPFPSPFCSDTDTDSDFK